MLKARVGSWRIRVDDEMKVEIHYRLRKLKQEATRDENMKIYSVQFGSPPFCKWVISRKCQTTEI